MRAWLIGLAITSVTFAGTTLYFAHQLSVERERPSGASTPVAAITGLTQAVDATPGTAPPRPTTQATEAVEPDSSGATFALGTHPMSEADIKNAQAEYSRRLLARIGDPQQREEFLAERRMQLRNSFPRLDQVLGLTPEQYARFIDLQAREQVDYQEASARCLADPTCDQRNLRWSPDDSQVNEIARLLGPEGQLKFDTYKNTMGEREAVTQLRGRLSDSQRLGEERAELLITALAQERETISQEIQRSGTGMTGFGIGAGMVFAPGDELPFEERYEAARRYSQRLRDRAAQYLNAEQQRIFNEMQEDTLVSLRGALRNKNGADYTSVTINAGS